MDTISGISARVGLSRATLLYYERIGLIRAKRQKNGYRVYTDRDLQRLRLLRLFQSGGLTLKECGACLDGRIDRDVLKGRFAALESEIRAKERSRDLLAALLGRGSLKSWHEELERVAPDLHRDWLVTQGFSSDEAGRVALLSKDMNDHERYMAGFFEIFSGLDYWGPGTPEATQRALSVLPFPPKRILEIGCGNGVATMVLAARTEARITAIDTDKGALARLKKRAAARGFADRIDARNEDMARLSMPKRPYDVIWAEGSAYIIGIDRALRDWPQLLRRDGVLVYSDMVWRAKTPRQGVRRFFAAEYPAMTTVTRRLDQARRAGYRVLAHFDMGQAALDAYYRPLEARVKALAGRMAGQRVLKDLRAELRVWREGAGQFGQEMFVLQRD
ncbi:MAG: MerR family transcriptional regulator [Alphaproteobacteria bacterium]|nr:MerR family transcriptional regulator [Alphaproteobacteria bacterium]